MREAGRTLVSPAERSVGFTCDSATRGMALGWIFVEWSGVVTAGSAFFLNGEV